MAATTAPVGLLDASPTAASVRGVLRKGSLPGEDSRKCARFLRLMLSVGDALLCGAWLLKAACQRDVPDEAAVATAAATAIRVRKDEAAGVVSR